MPSPAESTVITGLREVCAAFPKSSKAMLLVVNRESDTGKFNRLTERAGVISMMDAWQLEGKPPTATFAPSDAAAVRYVRSLGESAAQAACKVLVVVDLEKNMVSIYLVSKGMCFVATAAFGSPMEPHVRALSQFRDDVLLESAPGRRFVRFYYRHSPALASVITRHEGLRAGVRWCLVPFVGAARWWATRARR